MGDKLDTVLRNSWTNVKKIFEQKKFDTESMKAVTDEVVMVVAKVFEAAKWTAETAVGAVQAVANTKGPIPPTDLHPRMPARPWTAPEYLRMWSWRHCWKYLPVFRFYIYSGIIVFGIFKFVVPIKPRHRIMYTKGKEDSHHHEVEHWYGIRQKKADKEYFMKYNPLKKEGEAEVGGH
ncbi:hypothetical protein Q1695_003574 [Nippostrongylus brasiliensis]|nr:hypothetical protein Q1695_003574 [Nippostrongylus brasiliensis]